jgi:hypothetical protein
MAALESIMITGVIEAKEERDIMTCNILNAFIQALLLKKDPGEDRVVMKITGVLVDMLVDINPELYGPEQKEGSIRRSIEGHIRLGCPLLLFTVSLLLSLLEIDLKP